MNAALELIRAVESTESKVRTNPGLAQKALPRAVASQLPNLLHKKANVREGRLSRARCRAHGVTVCAENLQKLEFLFEQFWGTLGNH